MLELETGPIDYETFMQIGRNFLENKSVYGENSFYPMPYVGIFSLFSQIPFEISFLIWVFLPVIFALFISNLSPWILLFAPLFSHFTGGQTAIFGMLGLWGYRKNQQSLWGGVWLSLLLIKPQLAIAPLAWAGYLWVKDFLVNKKVPRQMIVFICSACIIFLPWFAFNSSWLSEWLSNPRSLRLRAMAGLIPRLMMYLNIPTIVFWIIIGLLIILTCIWVIRKKKMDLDIAVLLSFILLPIVHDYDLIQIIPLLNNSKRRIVAFFCSIPLWLTILFAYSNDHAWMSAAVIAPVLFWFIFAKKPGNSKHGRTNTKRQFGPKFDFTIKNLVKYKQFRNATPICNINSIPNNP